MLVLLSPFSVFLRSLPRDPLPKIFPPIINLVLPRLYSMRAEPLPTGAEPLPTGIFIQMKESYSYAEELYKEELKNDNA